jgi:hypothetical protein
MPEKVVLGDERDYREVIVSGARPWLSGEGIAALGNVGASVWSLAEAQSELGVELDCSS